MISSNNFGVYVEHELITKWGQQSTWFVFLLVITYKHTKAVKLISFLNFCSWWSLFVIPSSFWEEARAPKKYRVTASIFSTKRNMPNLIILNQRCVIQWPAWCIFISAVVVETLFFFFNQKTYEVELLFLFKYILIV